MRRVLTLASLLVVCCLTAKAQDPVKVAPNQCKVDFENEQVRVLRWKVGPKEKTPMHEHPATVTVMLTGGKVRFTTADGKSRDVDSVPGQTVWAAAEKHSSQNLSDKATEVIQIELKPRAPAK
jgi:quercetin dioxygenase-like cupin family protein